jgi:hypothetical protein
VFDRVRVVGAHFVIIRLALNSTFGLNCQQKFNFWAASRRKFPSSSTLLNERYVPSPLLELNFRLGEASTDAYEEKKLTSSRSSLTADHGVWPLDFNNKNRLKKSSNVII